MVILNDLIFKIIFNFLPLLWEPLAKRKNKEWQLSSQLSVSESVLFLRCWVQKIFSLLGSCSARRKVDTGSREAHWLIWFAISLVIKRNKEMRSIQWIWIKGRTAYFRYFIHSPTWGKNLWIDGRRSLIWEIQLGD